VSQTVQDVSAWRKERRLAVTRGLLAHIESGSTTMHPDGPRFMPASEYVDEELHRREHQFFRTVPLVFCTSVEVASPGAFKACEISGVPLLVVRDRDGQVRAFLNACPHRGAQLACDAGAFESRITCPYHNWSFGLDGHLAAVTHPSHVGPIDKQRFGLVSLPCEERHGLVFGIVDPHARLDLDDFLGDFDAVLAGLQLDGLTKMVRQSVFQHRMNWKIALSTYFESYHFRFLHKNTVGPGIYPDMTVLERFGSHAVTYPASIGISAVEASDDESLTRLIAANPPFSAVHFIFPNTVITETRVTEPVSVAASHVVTVTPGCGTADQWTDFQLLASEPSTEEAAATLELMADITFLAGEMEDYATVQHTQRAMESGLLPGVTFGANELLLTEIHRAWAQAVGRPFPDQPVTARPGTGER
jgi:nitrite reductase/ring-hydroxylating ferredoxin subunit